MSERARPYVDRPLGEYVREASGASPTPGGGSVAALGAALGASMASMAANFTVGRKKFRDVEPEVKELLGELKPRTELLLEAMQKDTEAYAAVGAAYGSPKSTDDEKARRKDAIQSALRTAMGPPLDVLRASLEAARATRRLLDIANPNLITDVGVAGLLLEAAARSAWLNVAVNLNGIDDASLVRGAREECARAIEEIARLAKEVSDGVDSRLAKGAK